MFCPNCGRELDEAAKVCPACGALTEPAEQPAPAWEAAAPEAPEPVEAFEPVEAAEAVEAIEPVEAAETAEPEAPAEAPAPLEAPAAFEAPIPASPAFSAGEPVAVEAKKPSAKKGLLIGLGCVLLAALIGFGVWFLTRRSEPDLAQAAQNSLAELKAYTEDLPKLHAVLTSLEKLQDAQGLHLELNVAQDSIADGQKSPANSVAVKADLIAEALRLSGVAEIGELELDFTLFVDPDRLQLAVPAVLGEGEALSLPCKDFVKQFNASALAKLLGLSLPDELDGTLASLQNARDLETSLEQLFGQDWIQLRDSFRSEKYEGTPHFEGKGVTYTLLWDRDALKRIYEKVGNEPGSMVQFEGPEDLRDLIASVYMSFLGQMNEQTRDLQLYVEGGKLVGLYLEVLTQEEHTGWAELRLQGEGNLWERLSARAVTELSSYTLTERAEITLSKEDGQLRLDFTSRSEQSDSEEFTEEEGPYSLIYSEADGSIRLEREGKPLEDAPGIFILPAEGGFLVKAVIEEDQGYGYGGETRVELSLSDRVGPVEPLSQTPTELLKLSEQELMELIQRIYANIAPLISGED